MAIEKYISKANQHLKGENFYEKLNEDPTRKHNYIVNNIIESFKKQELLFTSIAKKLTTTSKVRTPQFYMLPKYINQTFQEDQL